MFNSRQSQKDFLVWEGFKFGVHGSLKNPCWVFLNPLKLCS